MQRRLAQSPGGPLSRIGVNTGYVVLEKPRQGSASVAGNPVNVCALLQQAAAPGEVLVGSRTVAAVGGAFEFAAASPVSVRGMAGAIGFRRLVRALSPTRPRGVAGLRSAFVGRAGELADLRQAYARAVASGRPQLVTVVGEAGVGKTRLLGEFWQWLGGQARPPLLQERPVPLLRSRDHLPAAR